MHLFFDLDGTLTDSKPGILASMRHALHAVGVEPPVDDELARLIGPPTHDAFAQVLGTTDESFIDRAVTAYRERFATIGMFENSVYPGILDGLAALQAGGFAMWVVTSKPQVYARTIAAHFGLRPFFREVYGSELDGTRGNKAELIAHVLGLESITPRDTWMIGDRLHDIVGGKKNGLMAAGVLWGYGSQDELRDAGADALFGSMPELVAAFHPARRDPG